MAYNFGQSVYFNQVSAAVDNPHDFLHHAQGDILNIKSHDFLTACAFKFWHELHSSYIQQLYELIPHQIHHVFSLFLPSSAVEQVLNILMDILSWEIAEVVSPCLPSSL